MTQTQTIHREKLRTKNIGANADLLEILKLRKKTYKIDA